MSGDGPAAADGDTRAFRRRLAELKRRGCGFLVTGPVADSVIERSCRRAFGDDSRAPRRRLLVATDRPRSTAAGCLPAATHRASRTTIIDHAALSRSVAADTRPVQRPLHDVIRIERPRLSVLGKEIVAAVETFEADCSADTLEPGSLRVCLDSLTPLLAEYDHERVFRFLHHLLSVVGHANGMAHVYLPTPPTHETVRLLEPLFDAVIELRMDRTFVEQRWTLRDGPETGWFQL